MSNDRWLSPRVAAEMLDISIHELRMLVDQGVLPSRRTIGGHRRVRESAVYEFLITGGGASDVDA